MRAVDTNVLVRLLARDDPKQVTAADAFVESGAWISHLVLMEAVWVLDSVYSVDRAAIATSIEMLLDHADLSVQDSEVVQAAVAVFRKRATVGFSDCLILEVARRAGHLPLGTFDRDFAKVEGTQLVK